jgi:hypothetical protein
MSESLRISDILDKSSYRKGYSPVSTDNIRIPGEIPPSAFKFKRKGKGEYIVPSSKPLIFSKYSTEHLQELLSRYSSSGYEDESLAYTDSSLAYEARKCYRALEFWEMTPGRKRYTKEEIFRSTLLLGPTYAEKISDEWDYGIRRSHRIRGIYQDFETWEPIVHYNELPPVAYLIKWEETSDDIEYMKLPLSPFNEELMEELRSDIDDCLPDDIEFPTDIEILSEVKTSTTYDLDKGKTIPFYMGRLSPEGTVFSQIFKARRSIVPVAPANTRDTVVTTIDTYNSVKKCDLIMARLLDDIDESLVCKSGQVLRKRLDQASRTPYRPGKQFYWLRDIKKCGLTFPRELIHLVQECLQEKYPERDLSCFNIYRNYSIFGEDNKPIKTVRGYCLGMANNCVTFIQCMIYRMIARRIPQSINIEGYFGNDDSLVKVTLANGDDVDSVDAQMIQIIDYELLQGLNIITNDKKSFWSWFPIIFEEYGKPEFKKKDSRLACALSSCLLAPDIKYAKLLSSSISQAFWDKGDWINTALRRITDVWGYEYYPEESNYDFSLGGWISLKSEGCSLALRQVMDAPPEILSPMWTACRQIRNFQKEVIRPVMKGTVTKNYSVTGAMLNITYVDTDLYDIPELPVEMIYLDKEGYKSFYESIYRFNRNPYRIMASRLSKVIKPYPRDDIDKMSMVEYMLGSGITYAIPEQLVLKCDEIFDTYENSSTDCSSLQRNSLSRFIEQLRVSKILTCTPIDIYPSGEYPYVNDFDSPSFIDRVNKVLPKDGEIPKGIYQFSTNPWLPLSEYTKSYDTLPQSILRLVEDRKHLPIWFMTKQYRNSREVHLAYSLMDAGEDYVDEILGVFRDFEYEQNRDPAPEKEFDSSKLCFTHQAGYSPWDAIDDIFNTVEEDCIPCMLERSLWSARKRTTTALELSERYDAMRSVPKIRQRIKHFIEVHYPILLSSLPRCMQEDESNDLFSGGQDSGSEEEDIFADMFG